MATATKILVQVSPELKARVEAAAAARETTLASYVRGAVIEKLEREANQVKEVK